MLDQVYLDRVIMAALEEDMPLGDITTNNIIGRDSVSKAVFIAREEAVIAGLEVAGRTFKLLDHRVEFNTAVSDGSPVKSGDVIARVEGSTRALLAAERTALNFLQRLSGIATLTARYIERVRGLPVRIVDTRKTTPGLRRLEKYAVTMGGGHNHRYCLSDGILIKDNHIKAAGGIKPAVEMVRAKIPHTMKIEVETESLDQVREALEAGADIIMLDNMDIETMREAAKLIGGRALVEASGNIDLSSVEDVARTGVDIISVGKITHSARAIDISMKFV